MSCPNHQTNTSPSQSPTPPPSPRTFATLLKDHIASLDAQAQSIKQLGISLLSNGADPTRPDILELDAMYRRTAAALEDAKSASEMHSASRTTSASEPLDHERPQQSRPSLFGSSDADSTPQSPTEPSKTIVRKRTASLTSHHALPYLAEPSHKRLRQSEPEQSRRKDFANPYETSTAPPAVEDEDISALVAARLAEASERQQRRRDLQSRQHDADAGRDAGAQTAGHKHRRSLSESDEPLTTGQDGGRYWLPSPSSSPESKISSRIQPIFATLSSPREPLSKKLKIVHDVHVPRRKEVAPPSVREKTAERFRREFGALGAGVAFREVENERVYDGSGVKRVEMRKTVEGANTSGTRGRAKRVVGILEGIGDVGSGKVGGLEFGKRAREEEEGWEMVRGKRRRVVGWV